MALKLTALRDITVLSFAFSRSKQLNVCASRRRLGDDSRLAKVVDRKRPVYPSMTMSFFHDFFMVLRHFSAQIQWISTQKTLIFHDLPRDRWVRRSTSTQPFWTNRYARTIYGSRSLHFCNNIGYVFCSKNNMSSDNIGKYRDFRIPER